MLTIFAMYKLHDLGFARRQSSFKPVSERCICYYFVPISLINKRRNMKAQRKKWNHKHEKKKKKKPEINLIM